MKKFIFYFAILSVLGAGAWVVGQVVSGITSSKVPTQMLVDSSGRLVTQDRATQVDDAVFTPATSGVTMFGAEFDDTSTDSVNEGDGGACRMSANRNLFTTIRDAAGNERGANVNASNQLAVVEASGSAIATSLAIMDDWDSSDTMKATPFVGGTAVSASNPLAAENQPKTLDADNVATCVAITDTDADFTLQTGSDFFKICSYGNVAYINCAAATPAVDHTVGAFSLAIPESSCMDVKITEPVCAVIGVATAGFVCFYNYL